MNHCNLVENKNLTEAKVGFGFDPHPYTAKALTIRNRIKLEHVFLATSRWVEDMMYRSLEKARAQRTAREFVYAQRETEDICQNIGSPFARVHDIVQQIC